MKSAAAWSTSFVEIPGRISSLTRSRISLAVRQARRIFSISLRVLDRDHADALLRSSREISAKTASRSRLPSIRCSAADLLIKVGQRLRLGVEFRQPLLQNRRVVVVAPNKRAIAIGTDRAFRKTSRSSALVVKPQPLALQTAARCDRAPSPPKHRARSRDRAACAAAPESSAGFAPAAACAEIHRKQNRTRRADAASLRSGSTMILSGNKSAVLCRSQRFPTRAACPRSRSRRRIAPGEVTGIPNWRVIISA